MDSLACATGSHDGVRFTTKPDPTYSTPAPTGNIFRGFNQQIQLDTITSVEKVTLDTIPPATGKAVSGKEP